MTNEYQKFLHFKTEKIEILKRIRKKRNIIENKCVHLFLVARAQFLRL